MRITTFVGHRMGIQVHDGDAFGEYRHNALQEGTFISNEPGLYGDFSITLNGVRYEESIGIRIEDTLRIEKDHATNCSTSIPKSILEIETLLN